MKGKSREPRKVCVVLVDRANYGRLKPVMAAIKSHRLLELQTMAAGTMVLDRFDRPVDLVREDGFQVDGELYLELEGSTPTTMAKSVGLGIVEFTNAFQRLRPDVVMLIGDRYETLAAAIAAAYMNLCIAHVQGGEVTGSIDESARHAITKFAHFHFPSTERAARYLVRMGERPDTILNTGCPSSDIARQLISSVCPLNINERGSGSHIDLSQPYLLAVLHPTTTQFGDERQQTESVLEALHGLRTQTIMLWPNIDAGAGQLSKTMRRFQQRRKPDWLRLLINLPPEKYLRVLANAACAIGNSSSFVRDASFFGTPVVLTGSRQNGREVDRHLTRVPFDTKQLAAAIQRQLEHGRYTPSTLYGNGQVAERIADAVANLKPYTQKQLDYRDSSALWPMHDDSLTKRASACVSSDW